MASPPLTPWRRSPRIQAFSSGTRPAVVGLGLPVAVVLEQVGVPLDGDEVVAQVVPDEPVDEGKRLARGLGAPGVLAGPCVAPAADDPGDGADVYRRQQREERLRDGPALRHPDQGGHAHRLAAATAPATRHTATTHRPVRDSSEFETRYPG